MAVDFEDRYHRNPRLNANVWTTKMQLIEIDLSTCSYTSWNEDR